MTKKYNKILFYTFLLTLYLLIFIAIYGYINFDINYTDWCLIKHAHTNSEDIKLNYLNFLAFLNDSSPIPYYKDMIYPYKGSLLYIDYAPLIAVFVKILYKNILNIQSIAGIQYAWWFGSICFILQGIISFKMIKKITNTQNINAILCSIFFVIAPPLIMRFPYHFTLCAQFLILLSFCPFIFKRSNNNGKN